LRMPSKTLNFRHEPKQERAGQTVERVLEAAASLMGEIGYEAATMTAIAQRAGTSIGTVYQYFPKKEDVVLALRTRFGEAMEEDLRQLSTVARTLSLEQIAGKFIEQTRSFVEKHPAYFHIMDAPIKVKRSSQARDRLRSHLIAILRTVEPSWSDDVLRIVADVIPSLCKAMCTLYAEAAPERRSGVVAEYVMIMTGYLASRQSRTQASPEYATLR
jgi:AcrR family transcriptional regulator